MAKKALESKLDEISALRSAPEPEAQERLRRALQDKSNYIAAKAADVIRDRRFDALAPDLAAAFDRFMTGDPQCAAKNAIAKALKDLDYTDPAVYLKGIHHVQMEPVWGGEEDSAVTLRGTCAHALIVCPINSFDILLHLTGLLNDPAPPVRIDGARAIAQLSAREGALPLRLKALIGDREPEVIGNCFYALLSLAPRDSLPFVAKFLRDPEPDLRVEAAGALAECSEPEAIGLLERFWAAEADPRVKHSLMVLLGASMQPQAAEFLLGVVRDSSRPTAAEALKALSKNRHRAQLQAQIAEAIAGKKDPELTNLFTRLFEVS
jgi:HEAT repeat protein